MLPGERSQGLWGEVNVLLQASETDRVVTLGRWGLQSSPEPLAIRSPDQSLLPHPTLLLALAGVLQKDPLGLLFLPPPAVHVGFHICGFNQP